MCYNYAILFDKVKEMTGIIIMDKPEGITSFGAVARVRRICNEKKCGHTGTLDPMATGVLTVMLGGATRFSELLPSHDKSYIASLRLGTITDTLDITGKVLELRPVNASFEAVRQAAESFKGEINQLPPMYSAVSVNGQRLYELARQGIEVERKARTVNIFSLDFLSGNEESGEYEIAVSCSSGTYIRTLIADIGEKLGCGAVMTALRRTRANGFDISDAITLDELREKAENGTLSELILPVDRALDGFGSITVTEAQAKRFSNGGELFLSRLNITGGGMQKVYAPNGDFLGVGEPCENELKVRRVFHA